MKTRNKFVALFDGSKAFGNKKYKTKEGEWVLRG